MPPARHTTLRSRLRTIASPLIDDAADKMRYNASPPPRYALKVAVDTSY